MSHSNAARRPTRCSRPATVESVYRQISRAVREPDVQDLFAKGGSEAMALPPAEMARAARELDRRWGEIIRQLGVTLD